MLYSFYYRSNKLLFFVWLLSFAAFSLFVPGPARAESEPITLVFVSHLADVQQVTEGGLPEVAQLVKQLRSENKKVLVIHGGNALGPSLMSSLDKGAHIIGLWNQIEPDAMGLGKRDLVRREAELSMRAKEAAFPLTSSNIVATGSGTVPDGLSKTTLLTVDGRRIGVCSLASPAFAKSFIQDGILVQGGFNMLGKLSRSLIRDKDAEYVIALADYSPNDPRRALDDSDANILYVSEARQTLVRRVFDKLYILHESENDAVIVELVPRPSPKITESPFTIGETRVVSLKDYPPDAELKQEIERYLTYLYKLMNVRVTTSLTPLDTRVESLQTGENAFGNLVADAMRDYYKADAAIIHAGGINGNKEYPAGHEITKGDLQSELPYRDQTCLMHLTGKALRQALEHGLTAFDGQGNRFLHLSGIAISFSPDRPAGSRLVSATINGKNIDPDTVYSVSVPTQLAKGAAGFSMLGRCDTRAVQPSLELVEVVRAYIDRKDSISPVVDGRITRSNG